MKKHYKTTKAFLLSGLMTIGFALSANAQAPANDECAGAINVTQASSYSACAGTAVNTTNATQSADPIDCSTASYDDDVWYKFTAASAQVIVRGYNKAFAAAIGYTMYDACGGTQSAECEFGAPGDSLKFSNLTIGNVYYLRTFVAQTTDRGTYDLCIYTYTPPPPPSNDNCANAITLTQGSTCSPTAGTLLSATESELPDDCNAVLADPSTGAKDVWYKFVATTANATILVNPGSANLGAIVQLYTSCGSTAIDCEIMDGGNFGSNTELRAGGLTIGNTYHFRVYGYEGPTFPDPQNAPNFDVCVFDTPPPPANDECSSAIMLTQNATCVTTNGSILNATESELPEDCGAAFGSDAAKDVWYKFVATATKANIKVNSPGFGSAIQLYSSCGTPSIDCKVTVSAGEAELNATGLTSGSTYYFRIYGFEFGGFIPDPQLAPTFTVCVYNTPPAPANDNCEDATQITAVNNKSLCVMINVTTVNATKETSPEPSCAFGFSDNDVWYKFTALDTAMTIWADSLTFAGGVTSVGMAVFKDSLCEGPQIGCSANTHTNGDSLRVRNLIIGQSYNLALYSSFNSPSEGSFEVCVYAYLPDPPPNGINNINKSELKVTPNPNNGTFKLKYSQNEVKPVSIKVYNVGGQVVYNENLIVNKLYEKNLNISDMPAGVYILQMVTGSEVITQKIIKN